MELKDIRGLGEKRLQALAENGIDTIGKLILTLPHSYKDLTQDTPVREAAPGADICVTGRVCRAPKLSRFKGLSCVSALFEDDTGTIGLQWFNQPWMKDNLPEDGEITLHGKVTRTKKGNLVLNSPQIVTERALVPVYTALKAIPAKTLQQVMKTALENVENCLPETLPDSVREKYGLCGRHFALRQAHFPTDHESLSAALRHLSFEGLLFYQAATVMLRGEKQKGKALRFDNALQDYLASLPFPLTGAQTRVLNEIAKDISAPTAMNRLVQGDVGCGKTAVAFGAMYMCARAGRQSVLLAPTEILARQHFESAKAVLGKLGISCGLLLGGMKVKERREALQKIQSGEWQCVIGTHALLSRDVEYAAIGLIITDEQHRFGVRQRNELNHKTALRPHALVMSATPIPRSLALVLWGDLDISVIDEMPAGRKPVRTMLVPEKKREDMYRFLIKEAALGHQAYIVCPLVSENEQMDAAGAQELYAELSTGPLRDLRLGLTYGGQKPDEKEKTLAAFSAGEIQVLIATTVVEVGVNVPAATCMVIEDAQRFGLSQLHQLRGRVGRGADESWCFLMAEKNERLDTLCKTGDGFKIAEKDLELRGPGDFLGTRQHGALLPGMNFTADVRLIEQTRDCLRDLQSGPPEDLALVRAQAAALFRQSLEEIVLN